MLSITAISALPPNHNIYELAQELCDESEHEALSSTVIRNFAIPHTMKMQEINSCMYIPLHDILIE